MSEWSKERDWKSRIRQRIEGSNPSRSASNLMLNPTPEEVARRDFVMRRILQCVVEGTTIKLPAFDPTRSLAAEFAMQTVGIEANDFGGTVGDFRYQFEGEEDLLHVIITRQDLRPLSPEEGHSVGSFLLPDVPKAFIWFKPGELSQHLYFGHDVLLEHR